MTLITTIIKKAINKGKMPILSSLPSWFQRLSPEAEAISFWTRSAINTKTPTKANVPAIADVDKIVTVEVVTVDIIDSPLNQQLLSNYNENGFIVNHIPSGDTPFRTIHQGFQYNGRAPAHCCRAINA